MGTANAEKSRKRKRDRKSVDASETETDAPAQTQEDIDPELSIDQTEPAEQTNSSSSPKKKKKKKEKASFGVVDSKLLAKSGGERNAEGENKPENSTRINKALNYLLVWKNDRKSWKFKKNLQASLLKAVYNPIIIPDNKFEILLLYLQGAKGVAREKLKKDAMGIIKEDADHIAEPADPDKEKRAREILQMLG